MSYWLRVFFRSVGGRSDASLRSVDECAACISPIKVQGSKFNPSTYQRLNLSTILNPQSMHPLYPLLFQPNLYPVIWGGRELDTYMQ